MKKIFHLLLIIALISIIFPAVVSAESDITGHWAEKSISRWVEQGIIKGYGGECFQPDQYISRAEFFAVIGRVIKLSEQSGVKFDDVLFDEWYAGIISAMADSGYVSGYGDGTIRPQNPITRQEVAMIFYKVFKINRLEITSAKTFSDSKDIEEWAINSVNQMVAAEYITGYDDNTIRPNAFITRAEAVKVLDNIVSAVYNAQTNDQSVQGNAIITASNTSFTNLSVSGDLYVIEGISGGEIRFDNVSVGGRIVFSAHGNTSLVLKDSKAARVEVDNRTGKNTVVATGETVIPQTILYGSSDIQSVDAEGAFETIHANGAAELGINATVGQLFVDRKSNISITSTAVVKSLNVGQEAENSVISSQGKVLSIQLHADVVINGVAKKADSTMAVIPVINTSSSSVKSSGGGGGVGGSVIPSDKDAYLTNLSIKEIRGVGAFAPVFSQDVTTYMIKVKNEVGAITFIPTTNNKWADCSFDGVTVESEKEYSYSLQEGKNVLKIDTKIGLSKKRSYIITVIRGQPADGQALANINAAPAKASIEDLQAIQIDNLLQSELDGYKTAIEYAIKAKGMPLTSLEIQDVIDSVNHKSALLAFFSVVNKTIYDNELELIRPNFSSDVYSYNVNVDNYVSDVILTAAGASLDSLITVNGKVIVANKPFNCTGLAYGDNLVEIQVTSGDKAATKTYHLTIYRDPDTSNLIKNTYFSDGASKYSLINTTATPLSDGWLEATPKAGATSFWDSQFSQILNIVPGTICVLQFEARTSDRTDKIIQLLQMDSAYTNNAIATNGTAWNYDIKGVDTQYTCTFTAKSLNDNKLTIRFDIGKGSQAIQFKNIRLTIPSTDATLRGLNLSPVEYSPIFDKTILNYNAVVESDVSQVAIDALPNGMGVAVSINGTSVTGSYTGNLVQGDNVFTITVTAAAGNFATYYVTVTKLPPNLLKNGSFTVNTDNWYLRGSGTLEHDSSGARVTGTPQESAVLCQNISSGINSGSKYMLTLSGYTDSGSKNLNIGFLDAFGNIYKGGTIIINSGSPQTCKVLVESPTGVDMQKFVIDTGVGANTLYITQLLMSATSSDATVTSMAVTRAVGTGVRNVMYPSFSASITSYTADFESSVDTVGITINTADSGATVSANGISGMPGGLMSVPITVGSNTVDVVVTSSDQSNTKHYTIIVNRDAPDGNLVNSYRFTGSFTDWKLTYTKQAGYDPTATLTEENGWLHVNLSNSAGPWVSTTMLYQTITLESNTKYTISGYVKTVDDPNKINTIGGSKQFNPIISDQWCGVALSGTPNNYPQTNSDGTTFSYTFTTPASLPSPTTIVIQCGAQTQSSGTLKDTRDLLIKYIKLIKVN